MLQLHVGHVVGVEQVTEVVLVVSGGGDEDVVVAAHVGVSGGV